MFYWEYKVFLYGNKLAYLTMLELVLTNMNDSIRNDYL